MICVILCGGAGSRLWPLSREMHPKPFFHIHHGKSLIGQSIETASLMPEVREILVVANVKLRADVLAETRAMPPPVPMRYIFEPVGRNTAAAIGTAAMDIAKRYGRDEPVLVLTADHLIGDVPALGVAVQKALSLAVGENKLVTFGITPTRPETEYGYIHFEGDRVLQFVEKPPLEKAQAYIENGGYLWNSGMFCFKAGVVLDELAKHAPDIAQSVARCYETTAPDATADEVALDAAAFAKVRDCSIDYAVMEKSDRIAVVACDIDWNDIGSWRSLSELYPAGDDGNRVIGDGEVIFNHSKNCAVLAPGKVVAVIGMHDTLIADTGDALLASPIDQAQEARQVYNLLYKHHHQASIAHLSVQKPWGGYNILHSGKGYKVKCLRIVPGASLSLQSHRRRTELWVVVRGNGMVLCDDHTVTVKPGDTAFIPIDCRHRAACSGREPLDIIEVQMGDYLGEDDIVRYEDAYGRV